MKKKKEHKFSLFDKVFSFTNRVRRKHVKTFLGEDFKNIKGYIGMHPVYFIKKIILPVTGLCILAGLIFLYYNYLKPSISIIESPGIKKSFEYLMIGSFLIWIYMVLNTIKLIYNIFVDYKNDFIITMIDGIYKSDKNGFFHHSQTKIAFDSIHNITSTEKHIFHSVLGTGFLYIKTTGDVEDIKLDFAQNIQSEVKKLKDLHTSYLKKNDIKTALIDVENIKEEKKKAE